MVVSYVPLSDWSHHGDSKVPLAFWCYSSSTHSSEPKTPGVKIWLDFSAIEKIVLSTNLVHGNQGMVSALLDLELQEVVNHWRWVMGTKLWLSGMVANDFNHRVVFLASILYFFSKMTNDFTKS